MEKQKMTFGAHGDASIVRNLLEEQKMKFGTKWSWEHWRDGKLIDQWIDHNICTDEGITYALDAAFSGGTQITTWYVIIFEDDITPVAGDTYAAPSFTESIVYTGATPSGAFRQQWQEAGVSAKSLTNSANRATLDMTANKTIYGYGIVGGGSAASTLGDIAGGGTLYCAGRFITGSKDVENGDTLKVTVTLTGADV